MKNQLSYLRCALILGAIVCNLPAAVFAEAPVTACDELGANPDDFDRVADGVYWTVLDGNRALNACNSAIEQYPEEPRFAYQYGRALARLGRDDEAITYLSQAAENGYLIAYTTLGGIYHFVTKNYAEAIKLYREGAELGSASAQVHLGEMYLWGLGIRKDPRQALQWYDTAAKQGYPLAYNKIADLYYDGNGVPQDYAKAAEHYRHAAGLGLPRAQHAMGVMSADGKGMARNAQAAKDWYTKSANQGYGESQLALGGIEQSDGNFAEAYFWYQLASRYRVPEIRDSALAAIETVQGKLDRATRKKVRQRTSAWRPVIIPQAMRKK